MIDAIFLFESLGLKKFVTYGRVVVEEGEGVKLAVFTLDVRSS